MDMKDFYDFGSKLSSSTVQVHALNLTKGRNEQGLYDKHRLIMGDYSGISFPVVFQQEYGKKLLDMLDTGWPSLYLISERMKSALEENSLKGWKIFSIKVLDKKKSEIPGYYGLSITGRCGPIDYNKSEIIEKQLMPNGKPWKVYKGQHVDLNRWDGSDFFLPEKNFGIIITSKAADVLKRNKFTNVRLVNLTEVETDEFTVLVAIKKAK